MHLRHEKHDELDYPREELALRLIALSYIKSRSKDSLSHSCFEIRLQIPPFLLAPVIILVFIFF